MKIRIDHLVITSNYNQVSNNPYRSVIAKNNKPFHSMVTSTIDGMGPITHHFWTKKIPSIKKLLKKIKRERGEK